MQIKDIFQNKEQIIYLDGATGSNLIEAGMPIGVCPEQWILEHPEVLIKLQKKYALAGSHIVYAPTFTCNRVKLEEYGLGDQLVEMNRALVQLSRDAVGTNVFVAGDITMTGEQLFPMGSLTFEELIEIYKEQAKALYDAGVDLFIVETMMSLQETRAAMIAIKEVCDLPFMITMTFEENGKCLYGTDPITAAVVAESLGAIAIGANCSTGPSGMVSIINEMAKHTNIPIIAKPNAGLPTINAEGNTVYSQDPNTFAKEMQLLVDAGATILGGCCGTTNEHISALVQATSFLKRPIQKKNTGMRYLTSETKTVMFSLDDPFMVIGERINPTGKKKLQEELRTNKFDLALQFADEQVRLGATFLDINVGMAGINEKDVMLKMIEKVTSQVNVPLVLDTSHVDVMEAALRIYPGRALINSISLESHKVDISLSLAKKYGAMFILLPLSDAGLPASYEEKIDIIKQILDKAEKLGLNKEQIIVDGLVTTVGANKKAAIETLETIRFCKENGLATTCGLSNISFGLPERTYLNAAFLTMAIQAGLTTAIANPSSTLLMTSSFASDLLLDKKDSALKYIEHTSLLEVNEAVVKKNGNSQIQNIVSSDAFESRTELENTLFEDVIKGRKEKASEHTVMLLEEGKLASDILNRVLIPAIDQVGEFFDKGKFFLPQLIAGAESMKAGIDILEPYLVKTISGEQSKNKDTVVIATVKGDIHDIGKNLVALMLKIYGFEVIDLGKDVPKEEIIETALMSNAKIICLSALMTTTMLQMKEVIQYAKEMNCHAKVMVGGAVITRDYAREIGADGYSEDAASAVVLAKKLTETI